MGVGGHRVSGRVARSAHLVSVYPLGSTIGRVVPFVKLETRNAICLAFLNACDNPWRNDLAQLADVDMMNAKSCKGGDVSVLDPALAWSARAFFLFCSGFGERFFGRFLEANKKSLDT